MQNGILEIVADGGSCDTLVAVLQGTSDGALLTDLEGKVAFVNPAAEVITGRTAGEAAGLHCAELLGCKEARECPLAGSRQGTAWTESLCRGTRADGRPMAVRARARVVVDVVGRPAGQLLLFSESSLQESLQQKMVAYERLASLGELATSMVHEVGNPVSVILGFARLLIQEEGADRDGELRDRIYREAERCRKIVEKLLDYARASSPAGRLVPLGLKHVAEDTLDLLSYRMKRKGIECEVEWGSDTPFVLADPGEMRQVLLNLLLNALDATEPGGCIRVVGRKLVKEVTIGGDSLLKPVAQVVERPWSQVRVENDGAGLGPGNPERFFTPFYTTKARGGGLGLPVCRRILTERGGSIRLVDRPGGGVMAVVELPGYGSDAEGAP